MQKLTYKMYLVIQSLLKTEMEHLFLYIFNEKLKNFKW